MHYASHLFSEFKWNQRFNSLFFCNTNFFPILVILCSSSLVRKKMTFPSFSFHKFPSLGNFDSFCHRFVRFSSFCHENTTILSNKICYLFAKITKTNPNCSSLMSCGFPYSFTISCIATNFSRTSSLYAFSLHFNTTINLTAYPSSRNSCAFLSLISRS